MHRKKKRSYIVWVSVIAAIGLIYIFRNPLKEFFLHRIYTDNKIEIELYVMKDQGIDGLKKQLKDAGVINNTFYFDRIAYLKDFTSEKIATGKYIIEPKTSIRNLINGFTENNLGNGNAEVEVNVSFDNSRTLGEMCAKISKTLMLDSAKMMKYIGNPETAEAYGFNRSQFPAMFIANTYSFFWDTTPEEFTKKMSQVFKRFWNAKRMIKLNNLGFSSPSQAVTLASIVYGEQSIARNEWSIIARLYLNRLKKGMLLQSDPTFKYCWGSQLDGTQILNYKQRNIDCPYNTYKYKGLPPGPINMPPSGAVEAVLNPDQNNYLYMVAKPDFSYTHYFTDSYEVHQKNAKIYQSWIRAQQKK